jgi:glycosyltransferase involved in cell wall biosynthesis
MKESILFFSTMDGYPWGGSEELWSRTALYLSKEGFSVCASVTDWSPPHKRILNLIEGGVDIQFRSAKYPVWRRVRRKLFERGKSPSAIELQKLISAKRPSLVVFSDGGPFSWIDLLEICIARGVRFVTIGQSNREDLWLIDEYAERYRRALATAVRCYFVSKANLRLAERHLVYKLSNAEVVWNPFNTDFRGSASLPFLDKKDELQMACVARLHPPSKGQDILFEVLAAPPWPDRSWHLNLYGEGPMRDTLERLAQLFALSHRVTFAGHVSVEDIWCRNHMLVMPSRYEGLPLAMVEAMLCGRPVVATDVAGHSEIIEDGVTGFLADGPSVPSLARALERFWDKRAELDVIGAVAAKRIRELVPPDPVRIFSDKIEKLAKSSNDE